MAMARFCLMTNITPAEYRQLTIEEVSAFVSVLNERVDDGWI